MEFQRLDGVTMLLYIVRPQLTTAQVVALGLVLELLCANPERFLAAALIVFGLAKRERNVSVLDHMLDLSPHCQSC